MYLKFNFNMDRLCHKIIDKLTFERIIPSKTHGDAHAQALESLILHLQELTPPKEKSLAQSRPAPLLTCRAAGFFPFSLSDPCNVERFSLCRRPPWPRPPSFHPPFSAKTAGKRRANGSPSASSGPAAWESATCAA